MPAPGPTKLVISTSTCVGEPLGVQVTVIPLVREIVRFAGPFGLVRAGNAGRVTVALKGPTSFPPAPAIVYVPGTKKVPAALKVTLSSLFTVMLPFGPVIVKLEPASSGAGFVKKGSLLWRVLPVVQVPIGMLERWVPANGASEAGTVKVRKFGCI